MIVLSKCISLYPAVGDFQFSCVFASSACISMECDICFDHSQQIISSLLSVHYPYDYHHPASDVVLNIMKCRSPFVLHLFGNVT